MYINNMLIYNFFHLLKSKSKNIFVAFVEYIIF